MGFGPVDHFVRLQTETARRGLDPHPAPVAPLLRAALFAVGGLAVVALTAGVGTIDELTRWWADPVAYEKFAIWTLLWELLGLGAVPAGGPVLSTATIRHRLRPGTLRLAPWPGIPFTAGTRRTGVDVGLYAAAAATAAGLLVVGPSGGTLPTPGIVLLIALLGLLGLRDAGAFLAARPEHWAVLLVVFLLPSADLLFALKPVAVAMWWSAATATLTAHFPYAVAAAGSSVPGPTTVRRGVARACWTGDPDDLRPAGLARRVAHAGTALAFLAPLVLLCSGGGALTASALTVVVGLGVLAAVATGRRIEWTVFSVYSALAVFGHHAGVGPGSVDSPLLVLVLVVVLIALLVRGAIRRAPAPLLPTARHLSGNHAASLWLLRDDLDGTPGADLSAAAGGDAASDDALAFRTLHLHGRALHGLLGRAADDLARYRVVDGDAVVAGVLGGPLGDGHLPYRRLLEAVQERYGFAPGALRVVGVEAQVIQRSELVYRILDAADGLVEQGWIDVDDLVVRAPWLDAVDRTVPVEVTDSVSGFRGYTTPAAFSFLTEVEQDEWCGRVTVTSPRRPRPAHDHPTNGHTTNGVAADVPADGTVLTRRPLPLRAIPTVLAAGPVPTGSTAATSRPQPCGRNRRPTPA